MVHVSKHPPYLYRPAKTGDTPFVFAAPHSGRHYPADLIKRSILNIDDLRCSEDAFVDKLFEGVTEKNASLLIATHARAYLDLNRSENELDPQMFTPQLDSNGLNISYRVQAGLGVVPQFVAENMPIYDQALPAREAEKRLANIHRPYHCKLRSLLSEKVAKFGYACLLDCHSMPSDLRSNGKGSSKSPNIILGDCWGSACSRELTSIAEKLFLKEGFRVRRNVPYSGGYSTSHYGAPQKGIHALQIEISRALYMNEQTMAPLPEFDEVKEAIQRVSAQLIDELSNLLSNSTSKTLAAE